MSAWQNLINYIESNFRVADHVRSDNGDVIGLRLHFSVADDRKQVVFVFVQTLMDGDEEWIEIESPIGRFGEISLADALEKTSNMVCGNLGKTGDHVTLVHSAPIENLDVNEFERPLRLIVTCLLYTSDAADE